MASVDAGEAQEKQRTIADSWSPILNRLREEQQHLIDEYGDSDSAREAWRYLEQQWGRRIIQASIGAGRSPQDRTLRLGEPSEKLATQSLLGDLEDDVWQCRKLFFGESGDRGASLSAPAEKPAIGVPPWEEDPATVSTVAKLAEKFVDHVRSESSIRRAENVRREVDAFVDSLPDQCGVEEAFSGPVLADYLAAIKFCQLASGTKRNRIASVSQFALWAFERDYIESIPRLIAAKKFKVEVAATEVSVYSDDEVVEILAGAKDRERLYILLALNCGFTQQDIADLRPDEFDPDAGAITRKRSKTKGHDAVPEVTRLLWTETKKFLREHASNDDERLLLNTTGRPLVEVREDAGKVKRTDAIAKAMARLRKRLGRRDPISFKVFRATAASKLGEHESYRAYAQHFLGHAPSNVADSHYVKPSQEQFDKAIRWLRKQWDYQRVDLSNRTGFLRGNPTHAN